MHNIVLITQARVGSSRLPNKIFFKINNKTLIEHFVTRSKNIKGLDKLIFAIPDTNENDLLEDFLKKLNVEVFRGSENDVLKRYFEACNVYKPKSIMRITSDCPLFDTDVAEKLIHLFISKKLDYISNNLEPTWPHGLDIEIFSRKILNHAFRHSKNNYEREHVTPWIRNLKTIKKSNLKCNLNLNLKIRLTIDYEEDYKFFKAIAKKIDKDFSKISIFDIQELINKNPELLKINEIRRER